MMVKRLKMETVALHPALLLLLFLLPASPAQDVRAVDHYISDKAPVAGIGVGEVVPPRPRPPQRTGASNQRTPETPYVSRETDRTISYVEDVLAGRADVSKGIQDAVFEPPVEARPMTSTGYSRVGASSSDGGRGEDTRSVAASYDRESGSARRPGEEGGVRTVTSMRNPSSASDTGYSRDQTRPVMPSRVVPSDSGRRTEDSSWSSVGSGISRDGHREAAETPKSNNRDLAGRPREERPAYESGSSRGIISGTSREDDRGSYVPVRDVMSTNSGSTRDGSHEDTGPVYTRKDHTGGSSVASQDSYSGSGRKDMREHVSVASRDPVSSRDSVTYRDPVTSRDPVPSRDSVSSRDPVISREPAISRDPFSSRDPVMSHNPVPSRDSVSSRDPVITRNPVPSRDSVSSRDPIISRDPVSSRDPVRSRDPVAMTPSRETTLVRDRVTVVDRSRESSYDDSRDTSVGISRDDVYDNSRGASNGYSRDRVDEHSQTGVYDDSRHTASDYLPDAVSGHSRGSTIDRPREPELDHSRDPVVEHSRDPVDGYSRDPYADDSRESVPHRTATSSHRQEPSSGSSWDPYDVDEKKNDRDSELARPQEYPRGESVEEQIYTSKGTEDLESAFGFDNEDEYEEDIDAAHSSRPLPKTQKPRQATAAPDRRGPRGPHPASPCPSVFSYEGTRAGKERWYGVVLISTDETLTGLRLEIRLDKRADLLGTWLGEVSSVDNIRYTIWNGRRRVEPGPPLSVKIFVKYNDQEYEPPRVRTIRLNGRQICPKEKATPMVPLPPVRPPPRPNQSTTRPGQTGGRPVQRPTRPGAAGVQKPSRPPARPQQKPVQPSVSGDDEAEMVDGVACGRIEVQPSPLITYGQRTARGQWPWHAAIYQSKGTDLSYICGGSLIGKRTILTAAHCVSRRYIDRPVDPESLVVYLGKYHLKLWSEGGVQDKQVLEVHVHPEYNSTDFRADIAILILSSPVEFTVYVKPICLWDKNRPGLNEVEGHEGVVVGWGYDESGMVTEDLMMAKMPVVSQQTCIWSYPQFFSHFTSDRTYCAGFRNGTSVCNGDSGGGMVFPKTTGGGSSGNMITWALRGIVSLSTSQANKRVCNTDHYVVFTDVVRFYDWMSKYH